MVQNDSRDRHALVFQFCTTIFSKPALMLAVTTPPPVTLDPSTINPSALNHDNVPISQPGEITEKKKKKKKKRAREDDQLPPDPTDPIEFIAEPGDGQIQKKQKRETKFVAYKAPLYVATEVNMPKFVAYKAPFHVATEVNMPEVIMPDMPSEPVAPAATAPEAPEATAPEITAVKPKSKKKKKDKGKAKDAKLAEQTDAQIEADSQASAAALLSAIVAASVTNHEIPPMAPSQFDPNQFMSYPPMQYGYPPGPFDPHGAPNGFAPPAAGGSTAFSELAFGSNEDLLRALQDLDMSKIANVLKSLGEAASANGPTFAPQLGFMPSQLDQLPPAPPVKQVAAASNSILGIPPTASSTSHRRTINMNLSANDQHTNPDHAHLLANKWLNASKLAELVRDEGIA